jgi:hypothetical protein
LGERLQQLHRPGPRDRSGQRLELDRVDALLVVGFEAVQHAVRRAGVAHLFPGGLDDPVDRVLDREVAGRHAVPLGDPDHLGAHPPEVVVREDQRPVEIEDDPEQRF